MNKKTFLSSLKMHLENYQVDHEDIEDILNDYATIIDEALEKGMDEATLIERLGAPKQLAKKLYPKTLKPQGTKGKIIALTPFLATIIFFILGSAYALWHPGWMVYLLIPIVAIVLEGKLKSKDAIMSLAPFVALIGFFMTAHISGVWHPTWAFFLWVPFSTLLISSSKNKWMEALVFAILVALYLTLELLNPSADNLLMLVLLWVPIYTSGGLRIEYNGVRQRKFERDTLILLVVISIGYIVFNQAFDLWVITSLVFLLIPLYLVLRIMQKEKNALQPMVLIPFVAIILFISVGYFFEGWHYSWLFFLLIPVIAILFEGKAPKKRAKGLSFSMGYRKTYQALEEEDV